MQGRAEEGVESLGLSEALFRELDWQLNAGGIALDRAVGLAALGRHEEAQQAIEYARETLTQHCAQKWVRRMRELSEAAVRVYELRLQEGDLDQAEAHAREAREHALAELPGGGIDLGSRVALRLLDAALSPPKPPFG